MTVPRPIRASSGSTDEPEEEGAVMGKPGMFKNDAETVDDADDADNDEDERVTAAARWLA